jgi:hypothetical protein
MMPNRKCRDIEGGSYSGLPHVNKVGPEGGQILDNQSVRALQALFLAAKP